MLQFNRTKKRGYTLIELVVVLAVIALISAATLPNIASSSDQQRLLASANMIRQTILDARTRSLAPSKADSTGNFQAFQVVFSSFPGPSNNMSLTGDLNTRTVSEEKAIGSCGDQTNLTGQVTLRTNNLQRNVFISQFYPASNYGSDNQAVIRFTVGRLGFVCGAYTDPRFNSTNFQGSFWSGKDPFGNNPSKARYLVIELSTTKDKKIYVVVDRQTGEVTVSRTNPQSGFVPVKDEEPPHWQGSALTDNNVKVTMSCGLQTSTVLITYKRALDYLDSTTFDSTAPVFYDISWRPAWLSQTETLITQYYYDVGQDTVKYLFTTDGISIAQQLQPIKIFLRASDETANQQALIADPNNYTYDIKTQLEISVTPFCGNFSAGGGNNNGGKTLDQNSGAGSNQACSEGAIGFWGRFTLASANKWNGHQFYAEDSQASYGLKLAAGSNPAGGGAQPNCASVPGNPL